MTRFARAKGSKASNERIPEKSTPWNEMKEEMERKKQEVEENKEREKFNELRQQNYNKFLKEQDTEKKTEWADFPDDEPKEKKIKKCIDKSKKSKKEKADKMISKQEMLEMLRPDAEVDAKVKELTSKIAKVLDKESKKKKKVCSEDTEINIAVVPVSSKKKKKQKKSKYDLSAEENDDAPTEVSSKVAPSEIKISKQKNKQKKLKIKSVVEEKLPETNTQHEADNKQKTDSKERQNTDLEDRQEEPDKNKMTKSMKKRLKRKLQTEKANGDGQNAESNEGNIKTKQTEKRNSVTKTNSMKRKFSDNYGNDKTKTPKKEKLSRADKIRENIEHKRRKPDRGVEKMVFNGKEVEIMKFDGFPVKKEDFERLTSLKKQMISKGIPRSEVRRTLKLERRRSEKALTREKKTVCFQCRKAGHMLSECPELNNETVSTVGTGICFKCGSTEHTQFECKVTKGEDFKFATCFVCREQGHISKQCPDNPKGMYPQGGACRMCGDVTHLKKDCPQLQQQKADDTVFLKTISSGNIESLDDDADVTTAIKPGALVRAKNKVIKF